MYALMCYQTALLSEFLFTHITRKRALTAMYALMCYQITAMYALMCYQIALCTECLITYHMNKDAHRYVRVGVLSDCSLY